MTRQSRRVRVEKEQREAGRETRVAKARARKETRVTQRAKVRATGRGERALLLDLAWT